MTGTRLCNIDWFPSFFASNANFYKNDGNQSILHSLVLSRAFHSRSTRPGSLLYPRNGGYFLTALSF